MNFSAERTLVAFQIQLGRQLADLIRLQAGVGIERLLENQLRRFGGDFFDVHAARWRRISTGPGHRAIDDDAQVQLAGDVAAFFDEHLPHGLPFRPGLDRDQRFAQQIAGHLGGLVGRLHQLHAALLRVVFDRAFAAAAGVDLGLHDGDRAAQFVNAAAASSAERATMPLRHGDAGLAEDLFGLKFVDFHSGKQLATSR